MMKTRTDNETAVIDVLPVRAAGACKPHYRTLWISDIHLGTRDSKAKELLEFLKSVDYDKLYVVGDFLDVWQMKRTRRWPQEHNDVVQKLLRRARKGTPIIYIPGNHDDFVANYHGIYGNITIAENDIHTTADGKRLLVMHGHEFDAVTMNARWLSMLGDIGYSLLLRANAIVNLGRRILCLPHWSLSAYLKRCVKNAVNFISHFESAVAKYAEMHSVHGIVCGHIHTPAMRDIRGVRYLNTGDWVETCSALGEHSDGSIEMILWSDRHTRIVPFEQENEELADAASA
jgi:UDP-2,3-diacylglucosamine pyrophosphatase LpxH